MGTKFPHMILIAALILTTPAAYAQELTIKPKLRQRDQFRLELTRTRENAAVPQQKVQGACLVDVRLIPATPQRFVRDWLPGETVIDNPHAAQDALIAAASDAVRGMRFRLTLSPEGEFTGLANHAEVVPRLQSMVEKIVQQLAARLPEQQRASFQSMINQVLSPSTLIASATREVELY